MTRKGASGACPGCQTAIDWESLSHDGVMHGRTEKDGGPFFTISCPTCKVSLVAEGGVGRVYYFYREQELPRDSRLRRALRFFFGKPEAPSASPGLDADRQASGVHQPPPTRPVSTAAKRFRHQLDVLGLTPDVTLDDVKKQFRALAKRYHPDLFNNASESTRRAAESRFVEISQAYRYMVDHWPS